MEAVWRLATTFHSNFVFSLAELAVSLLSHAHYTNTVSWKYAGKGDTLRQPTVCLLSEWSACSSVFSSRKERRGKETFNPDSSRDYFTPSIRRHKTESLTLLPPDFFGQFHSPPVPFFTPLLILVWPCVWWGLKYSLASPSRGKHTHTWQHAHASFLSRAKRRRWCGRSATPRQVCSWRELCCRLGHSKGRASVQVSFPGKFLSSCAWTQAQKTVWFRVLPHGACQHRHCCIRARMKGAPDVHSGRAIPAARPMVLTTTLQRSKAINTCRCF